MPWWKTAKGDRATFYYVVTIHILAAIGLMFFATPGWRVITATVALAWMGALGVTVCYHRALAHTALRLHPVVKHILIFFAMFNGSGSPDSWTANHRQHHSKVETVEDISSPWIGGFWWAHLRWLWQAGNVPVSRWSPDLDKPEYRFWRRMQIPLLAVSLFGGLAFGIPAFFWLGPMRLVASLHAQCFVNSIAHMREARQRRRGFLAEHRLARPHPLFSGRELAPQSPRRAVFRRASVGRAWQLDFGWYVIVLLEKAGLAKSVKRPSAQRHSSTV